MIILYNPQSSPVRKPCLPLSLLALSAVLEGVYDHQIVDGNVEHDPLHCLDQLISETRACVLAFTVMPGPQLQEAVPLARELKQRHPQVVIVWGGYFPSQHWEVCLKSGYVDYVVRGHGELVFKELLHRLDRGDQVNDLQGLAYLGDDGEPCTNLMAPLPHPAEMPPWNWDRIPMETYVCESYLGDRTLAYHSSYGCPFFCNFCAVVNMVNGGWLPQPAERVANVVNLYVERWGINGLALYDNNFFVSQRRTAEFAERLLGLGVNWWGEARIDTLLNYQPRTWQLMRDSGLRMVFMGAESGSAETLQRMDKGGTMHPDKTLEIARMMKSWEIIPEFSFVMGNPPDPVGDIRETMEFIRKVKQVNPQAEIIMYLYTPVPLSGQLFEEAQAKGFAFPQTLEEWLCEDWLKFSGRRGDAMPWLRQSLRSRMRDFERVLNAYYPTATDVKLTRAWRRALRAVSAWRYRTRIYRFPVELEVMHRLIAYQRPETTGF
ncbi:B12-binding domain-containing radical SAM protein [Candidatus Entotheonella palauensis]|uniref:B12-binding domain-containing radical SAM protein n=1 Tax=Candidatus Entotheonella palauensis TaxID=93172 RepID=UPI000B7EE3B4|nr:radical SAM protein [Candidatus Entotheonella palauensis]